MNESEMDTIEYVRYLFSPNYTECVVCYNETEFDSVSVLCHCICSQFIINIFLLSPNKNCPLCKQDLNIIVNKNLDNNDSDIMRESERIEYEQQRRYIIRESLHFIENLHDNRHSIRLEDHLLRIGMYFGRNLEILLDNDKIEEIKRIYSSYDRFENILFNINNILYLHMETR